MSLPTLIVFKRDCRAWLRSCMCLLIVCCAATPEVSGAAALICKHGLLAGSGGNRLGVFYGSTPIGTRIPGFGGTSGEFEAFNPGETCTLTATLVNTPGNNPGQNNIYATNVSGVGLGLHFVAVNDATVTNYSVRANLSNNPRLQAVSSGPSPDFKSSVVIVPDLYRIPGDLPAPGTYPITGDSVVYNTNDGGTWSMQLDLAVTIKATCAIQGTDIAVHFPTVYNTDFSGSGSIGAGSSVPIPISLSCSAKTPFPLQAYLMPANGSTLLPGARGMISVTGGVANLGVQILAADGSTPFSFDPSHPALLGNVVDGLQTLDLKAQLVQTGSAAPTLGNFAAGAILTLIVP